MNTTVVSALIAKLTAGCGLVLLQSGVVGEANGEKIRVKKIIEQTFSDVLAASSELCTIPFWI